MEADIWERDAGLKVSMGFRFERLDNPLFLSSLYKNTCRSHHSLPHTAPINHHRVVKLLSNDKNSSTDPRLLPRPASAAGAPTPAATLHPTNSTSVTAALTPTNAGSGARPRDAARRAWATGKKGSHARSAVVAADVPRAARAAAENPPVTPADASQAATKGAAVAATDARASPSLWLDRPAAAKAPRAAVSPRARRRLRDAGGGCSPLSTAATPAQASSPRRSTRSSCVCVCGEVCG